MEECNICFLDKTFFQELTCGHKLCANCFKKLPKTQCPFCRVEMTLQEKIMKRGKITNINPTLPSINIIHFVDHEDNESSVEEEYQLIHFASYYRQMYRKRRRNLTLEEVHQRRDRIKKREKMKWERREARRYKLNGYETL